jgi:TIR domain
MAQQGPIFISYCSEARDDVRPVVKFLESMGRKVWWDLGLARGKWGRQIDNALNSASCVLGLMTPHIHNKTEDHVFVEWQRGQKRGALVPVFVGLNADSLDFDFHGLFARLQRIEVTKFSDLLAGQKCVELTRLLDLPSSVITVAASTKELSRHERVDLVSLEISLAIFNQRDWATVQRSAAELQKLLEKELSAPEAALTTSSKQLSQILVSSRSRLEAIDAVLSGRVHPKLGIEIQMAKFSAPNRAIEVLDEIWRDLPDLHFILIEWLYESALSNDADTVFCIGSSLGLAAQAQFERIFRDILVGWIGDPSPGPRNAAGIAAAIAALGGPQQDPVRNLILSMIERGGRDRDIALELACSQLVMVRPDILLEVLELLATGNSPKTQPAAGSDPSPLETPETAELELPEIGRTLSVKKDSVTAHIPAANYEDCSRIADALSRTVAHGGLSTDDSLLKPGALIAEILRWANRSKGTARSLPIFVALSLLLRLPLNGGSNRRSGVAHLVKYLDYADDVGAILQLALQDHGTTDYSPRRHAEAIFRVWIDQANKNSDDREVLRLLGASVLRASSQRRDTERLVYLLRSVFEASELTDHFNN